MFIELTEFEHPSLPFLVNVDCIDGIIDLGDHCEIKALFGCSKERFEVWESYQQIIDALCYANECHVGQALIRPAKFGGVVSKDKKED